MISMNSIIRKLYWNIFKRHIYGITSPLRVLPDFIIIGAMKSGTTSLNYNIAEHPCVLPAAYDEIGFFDVNFELGFNWYRSLFPTTFQKKSIVSKHGYFATGEDTPFYFWREDAAIRIKQFLPKTKLLLLLRNPIDRAYSNYMDGFLRNTNIPSFEETIEKEIEIISNEKDYQLSQTNFKRYSRNPSHISKGFYAEQLEIWFKHFTKEQFCIMSTEELSKNPVKTMNIIFDFLDLPLYQIKKPQKRKYKKYVPMKENTRNRLIDFYNSYNKKLYDLIEKNFDWNK